MANKYKMDLLITNLAGAEESFQREHNAASILELVCLGRTMTADFVANIDMADIDMAIKACQNFNWKGPVPGDLLQNLIMIQLTKDNFAALRPEQTKRSTDFF